MVRCQSQIDCARIPSKAGWKNKFRLSESHFPDETDAVGIGEIQTVDAESDELSSS